MKKLVVAYQQMADLTRPKCGTCRVPLSCCSAEYCQLAIERAKEDFGVDLQTTKHPRLPLMGETGCTAAPHFRILCTLHVCDKHLMGRDPTFEEKYFQLRDQLSELEGEFENGRE